MIRALHSGRAVPAAIVRLAAAAAGLADAAAAYFREPSDDLAGRLAAEARRALASFKPLPRPSARGVSADWASAEKALCRFVDESRRLTDEAGRFGLLPDKALFEEAAGLARAARDLERAVSAFPGSRCETHLSAAKKKASAVLGLSVPERRSALHDERFVRGLGAFEAVKGFRSAAEDLHAAADAVGRALAGGER